MQVKYTATNRFLPENNYFVLERLVFVIERLVLSLVFFELFECFSETQIVHLDSPYDTPVCSDRGRVQG